MWRVAGSCFSWLSTVQPSMSGRKTSSEMALGWYSRARASASAPRMATSTLKPAVVRQIGQDARVVRIVLDDRAAPRRPAATVSRSSGTARRRSAGRGAIESGWQRRRHARRPASDAAALDGSGVFGRQVEREGAAHARHAAQLDFAAEQVGELAADGEAEAGAAVFAAGAGIGLLERLEDDLLLLGGMPMPVSATSKATTVGALRSIGCSALQPPAAAAIASRTPPWSVNLKAFDSRFFSTCCRRLRVGDHAAVELGIELDVEGEAAALGLVPEGPHDDVDAGC